MDAATAEALLEAMTALVEALDQIRTWLIVVAVLLVPVWADVALRAGWHCWQDVKARRERWRKR